jgi:hypothetical protein
VNIPPLRVATGVRPTDKAVAALQQVCLPPERVAVMLNDFSGVMAGLVVPAIHVLLADFLTKDVDAHDKRRQARA